MLPMQMHAAHSKPKALQHVSACACRLTCKMRPVRNHAFCSIARRRGGGTRRRVARTRTERFSRRSFIGCHIVSGFICIVKRPRRTDIGTTQHCAQATGGKNPFPTRAHHRCATARCGVCSARVREGVVAARNSLSRGFLPADLYAPCFIRALRSIDRATHEGIQAPRDTANLSRFLLIRVSPS